MLMSDAMIPIADYATLQPKFNWTAFAADQWVSLVKDAGVEVGITATDPATVIRNPKLAAGL